MPFLVFGGGTALCRGHRLIKRMSEDIDLKIACEQTHGRGARKRFKHLLTEALLEAGFKFDPENREQHVSMYSDTYFLYRVPYVSVVPRIAALRPEIQIEFSHFPVHLPTVNCSISSFVAEAKKAAPEIASFPCIDVVETAAEKFVALTRRIGEERSNKYDPDDTLLRHIYDLTHIHRTLPVHSVAGLARTIMLADAETRGDKYPAYRADPLAATREAIAALKSEEDYAQRFDSFQSEMVYGEAVTYSDGMAMLGEYESLLKD